MLNRDVLGLAQVDTVNKRVKLRFTNSKLEWCEGSLPTPDGRVELRWRKDGETLRYRLNLPADYAWEVDNLSGRDLVRE